MKQVTQNYKTGRIKLEDVEPPGLRPGGILVRTQFSVISTGTEGMKVREGRLSYLGKARARPDQVKKVLDSVRQQGLLATYRKVTNKLDSLTPLGYSLAGEIVAVGPGAEEFHVGQRVACAGAGYANHAEINFVPKNLATCVPEGVSTKHAAFATVGAISLQGLRRAEMQLGEIAGVIGLGLLGQILVQLLKAAGVHVVGVDLVEERCRLAEQLGADAAAMPSDPNLRATVRRLTDGNGADCVFITAGGAGNGPVELAVQIARDRGRVVDIGKTSLDLPWNEYYMKELDLRLSRSYGPGRYDAIYEEGGIDYPIGYVRWTEKRNLSAFLDLLAQNKVQLDPIISATRPFSDAEQVYQEIANSSSDQLGILFEYPSAISIDKETSRLISVAVGSRTRRKDRVRIGVIGAGNYASSMLLPHLQDFDDVELCAVATMTSLSGKNASRKFGFKYVTTNYQELLADQDLDAVMILTRHSSHARLVCEVLRSGKAVYVEKPLALTLHELELVRSAIVTSGNGQLTVGFNRRFSSLIRRLEEQLRKVAGPLVVHYRVHAGQLESGSWYLDQNEGSRFVGEGGHFIDVLSYLVDSPAVSVIATSLRPSNASADDRENMAVTIQYQSGSVGNLLYLTQGGSRIPKEYVEVFGGGQAAQLNNFESLILFEQDGQERIRGSMDKGQKNELKAFVQSVKTGTAMPISIDSLLDTTLTTLGVMEAARTGKTVRLADYWMNESSSERK